MEKKLPDDVYKALGAKLPERPNLDIFFHATPDPDACDHDWSGWREWSVKGQGGGGEQICTKCGMGAMTYSLRTGP